MKRKPMIIPLIVVFVSFIIFTLIFRNWDVLKEWLLK